MGSEGLALTTPAAPAAPAAKHNATALAPGFRFYPTDEELVCYYLKRKLSNKPVRFNAIGEIEVYKHDPWDLGEYSLIKTRDLEWFFFSVLDKKYENGARMNRTTGNGYWKATGRDREVRQESHLIGMKKTLVFHGGRAPGGQRTNWVMHEYRLTKEEFDKLRPGQEAYVLCRVFQKSNIGPPKGNRYAPFNEEDWDDDMATFPGESAADDVVAGDNSSTERISGKRVLYEQGFQSNDKELLDINELPRDVDNDSLVCMSERTDGCHSLCALDTQAPLSFFKYKRRRQNDSESNRANGSENSSGAGQDPSSSTTTTAETATMTATNSAKTAAISALLQFSQPSETTCVPLTTTSGAGCFHSEIPPSCAKLIKDLKQQMHNVSVETDTLKLEIMSAQAIINNQLSRTKILMMENEELRRRNKDA